MNQIITVIMKNQYNNFSLSLLTDDAGLSSFQAEEGRYQIAPPFYEQIRFALAQRSVSAALEVRAGS